MAHSQHTLKDISDGLHDLVSDPSYEWVVPRSKIMPTRQMSWTSMESIQQLPAARQTSGLPQLALHEAGTYATSCQWHNRPDAYHSVSAVNSPVRQSVSAFDISQQLLSADRHPAVQSNSCVFAATEAAHTRVEMLRNTNAVSDLHAMRRHSFAGSTVAANSFDWISANDDLIQLEIEEAILASCEPHLLRAEYDTTYSAPVLQDELIATNDIVSTPLYLNLNPPGHVWNSPIEQDHLPLKAIQSEPMKCAALPMIASPGPSAVCERSPKKSHAPRRVSIGNVIVGANQCSNCSATSSTVWRVSKFSPCGVRKMVCNACGLYEKRVGAQRPIGLKGSSKARTRQQKSPPMSDHHTGLEPISAPAI